MIFANFWSKIPDQHCCAFTRDPCIPANRRDGSGCQASVPEQNFSNHPWGKQEYFGCIDEV